MPPFKFDNIPVVLQDQFTPPLDLFFTQAQGLPTTLSVAPEINDLTVTVDSVADIVLGRYLGIFSGASGEGRFYFGEVLGVSGNVVTLDTPIDFKFDIGDPVISTIRNLNIDASGGPQIFQIQVGGEEAPIEVDITRIMIQMTTTGTPEFGDFGDITDGLTKGIVLRRVDGETRNIWNIKTNGELANLAYDVTFYDPTSPVAVNGIAARYTFAGQDKHGVTIRLKPGDALQIILQDNLSTLLSLRILAQGHIVQNSVASS
jgi:hypothetical protein